MKDQSFYITWLLVAGAATAAAVKDAEAGDREYAPVLSQRFLGISGSMRNYVELCGFYVCGRSGTGVSDRQ